jgi:hypothetical protein
MSTEVIHIKDAPANWKKNPQFVYIGRGSVWGNPYVLKAGHPNYPWIPMSRNQVCDLYKERILPGLMKSVHQLKGKTLVCYCHPKRCHGDALVKTADES